MSTVDSAIPSAFPSAMNLIAGMAATSTKKGKGDKPEVAIPEIDGCIGEFIRRREEAETAAALRDAAAGQIIAAVRPKRLEVCVRDGKVHSSVLVNGRLTFTQQKRYSVVPEERGKDLGEAFGAADCARFFKPTLKIGLKERSANDEAVLTRLLSSLGQEFFMAHFDVKRDLVVQDTFHNEYTTRRDVQQTAQPFFDEETIRPYSPSLKVA